MAAPLTDKPKPVVDECRKAFECSNVVGGYNLSIRADGKYESSHTNIMWEAWHTAWNTRPRPTASLEAAARLIASELGYDFDTLYASKTEWTDDRGKRHDINVPFKPDFIAAALAVLKSAGVTAV